MPQLSIVDSQPLPAQGLSIAKSEPAQTEQSFGAALREYGSKMNPITALEGLGQAIEHPVQAIKGLLSQNERLAQDAETAFKEGRYADAARHATNYLLNGIPGMGTASEEAGNKLSKGDIAGGLADTAALATQTALGIKTPAIVQGAGRLTHAAVEGVKAAAPDVATGGAILAGGELLGKLPGMEWPARAAVIYPAGRQIGRGIRAGVAAGAADLFPPPLKPLVPTSAPPWAQIIQQSQQTEPTPLPESVTQELTRPSEPAPVAPTVPQAAPQAAAAPVPPETSPQATVKPPTAQERAITGARATRSASADSLSQAFNDAGVTSDSLRKLRVWDWPKAAQQVGVDFPVTHTARLKLIRDTLARLEQRQAKP